VAIAAAALAFAPAPMLLAQQQPALTQEIPLDPAVRMGTLPNGLRYYIQPNREPPNRVELRLAVNAGSVLEDPKQLGLAHFLEHMVFKGAGVRDARAIAESIEDAGGQRVQEELPSLWPIVISSLLLLVILFLPGGLMDLPARLRRRRSRAGAQQPEAYVGGAGVDPSRA